MKHSSSKLIGILLILAGILVVGRILGFRIPISGIFFRGWWTLFLIVPGILSLIRGRKRKAGIKKLIIGVILFMFCQGITLRILVPLVAAAVLLYCGIEFLFRDDKTGRRGRGISLLYNTPDDDRYFGDAYEQSVFESSKPAQGNKRTVRRSAEILRYSALFTDKQIIVDNERFDGAELSCTLGGMKLDLRNSFVIDDVEIVVSCTLGDVEILVPEDTRIIIEGDAVLGNIYEKRKTPAWVDENTPVIRIKASCVLGNIDVK